MSLATSNRDGGRTNEAGHLRGVQKALLGNVVDGLAVSQRGAGANMSVDVAIGDATVPRSDDTYAHPVWNDAVYNQVIAAADGSNPRRDIVVMYVDYGETPSTGVANNTNGVVKITSVAGTAAGSPTDPSDATIQAAVGSGNPFIKLARVRVGAGVTSISDSVIDDLRSPASAVNGGGWQSLGEDWDVCQYSAWDNTNKIATILVPDSSVFTLGQKFRYWQTTGGWKYGFIVRKPNGTSIQVYQGHSAGYTLNNERIYLPAYSRDKAPDGFPLDPNVWTVSLVITTSQTQATTYNTVVNPGSQQLSIPMGIWNILSQLSMQQGASSASGWFGRAGLSTSNNSVSDSQLLHTVYIRTSTTSTQNAPISIVKPGIVLTAVTTFYLIISSESGAGTPTLGFGVGSGGSKVDSWVRFVCAYL